MKVLLGIVLAVIVGYAARAVDKLTSVKIDGTEYTDITKVYVKADGRITILFTGGGTTVNVDKVPADFLDSWDINKESRQNAKTAQEHNAAEELDRAIQSGCFREVDGVVYDIRKPQSGWTRIVNAKVLQVLDDGAIVNTTPQSDPTGAYVKNLPQTTADTDTITVLARLTGTYSYLNKFKDDRTIRAFDVGRVCRRQDIPGSVLSGKKAFDLIEPTGAPSKDIIATLPEREELKSSGSGFFVTEDGYIITNFHVVKDAQTVKIKNGENVFPAKVILVDTTNDLALIKVTGKFKPLHISDEDAQLGESAFTIGFPNIDLQGTEPKYTDGKISSLAGIRDDPKEYQISVPVQPGNSGGPLVDLNGSVIGVVVARLNDLNTLRASGSLPQNVNYAVKAKYVRNLMAQVYEIKAISEIPAIKSRAMVDIVRQSVVMVLVY